MKALITSQTVSLGYLTLRKQIEETLLLGRREIENAKVQTYWRTGKLIDAHIARY